MASNVRIVRDFKQGLSPVGLARKYGKTREQVETIVRRWLKENKE